MKKLITFLVLSATATGAAEFAGLGVFESNRIYEKRYDSIRAERSRVGQPADPESIHYHVVTRFGAGHGFPGGLWHGALGMPRVFISFAATMINRTTGSRIYTSHDPIFPKHHAGKPYIVGFALGIFAFVAGFALSMPRPLPADDDDQSTEA